MQRNMKARKGKAVSRACQPKAVKSQKPAQKKPGPRVRKPLTEEQRKRKNERARLRRASLSCKSGKCQSGAASVAPEATDFHRTVPASPRRESSGSIRDAESHTDGCQKAQKSASACQGCSKCASGRPDRIDRWVSAAVVRLERAGSGGIVRRVFEVPGGVAEVSVCRRACEAVPDSESLWSALADCCSWFLAGRTGLAVAFRSAASDISALVDRQSRLGLDFVLDIDR